MKLQKFQLSDLMGNISNYGTIGAKFVRNMDVRGNIIDALVNDGFMIKVSKEGAYNDTYAFTEEGRKMAYEMGLVDERGQEEDVRLTAKAQPVIEEVVEVAVEILPEIEEAPVVETVVETAAEIEETPAYSYEVAPAAIGSSRAAEKAFFAIDTETLKVRTAETMKQRGYTDEQIAETLATIKPVPEPEVGTYAWAVRFMDIKYGMAQTAFLVECWKNVHGVPITPNNHSGYKHTAADGFVENCGGSAFLTPLGETLMKAMFE